MADGIINMTNYIDFSQISIHTNWILESINWRYYIEVLALPLYAKEKKMDIISPVALISQQYKDFDQ